LATSIFCFDFCFHQPVPFFPLFPLIPFGTLVIIIECILEVTYPRSRFQCFWDSLRVGNSRAVTLAAYYYIHLLKSQKFRSRKASNQAKS
jgi:hypothetical protein